MPGTNKGLQTENEWLREDKDFTDYTKTVFNKRIMMGIQGVQYDVIGKRGLVHCSGVPDMTGLITFFLRIDPDVVFIEHIPVENDARNEHGGYVRRGDRWHRWEYKKDLKRPAVFGDGVPHKHFAGRVFDR